jgi:class 3 adenylate cyclase
LVKQIEHARSILERDVPFRSQRTGLWVWTIGIILALVTLELLYLDRVALQYWYLLAVPCIAAAFRFGVRGAITVGMLTLLIFSVVLASADQRLDTVSRFITNQIRTVSSTEDLARFMLQLDDLINLDKQRLYSQALIGLIIVILSSVLLGSSIDSRERTTQKMEGALELLKRYFSPGVVAAITTADVKQGVLGITGRKEMTILFADIRDFTRLSDREGPDETIRFLNEFFTVMTEEIFRNDGTLDKYIGDGILAYFGDPVWFPDHAERAFKTALSMQQRMRRLQAGWEMGGRSSIGMGIGIASGPVIVGNVGSPSLMGYTVLGSTVNIAARLCDLAKPGQILTTRKTYERVSRPIIGLDREPTMVKGFEKSFELVEVIGARTVAQAPRVGVDPRLLSVVRRVVDDPAFRGKLLSGGEDARDIGDLNDDERSLAYQVAVLCGYPIFQGVPAEEVALVTDSASLEHYAKGTVIIREGSWEGSFYIILQGDVVVTATDESGHEEHIASLARGHHFGEISALYNVPRTATVRATSPTRLLVISKEQFGELLDRAPTLAGKIESVAGDRTEDPFLMQLPKAAEA